MSDERTPAAPPQAEPFELSIAVAFARRALGRRGF